MREKSVRKKADLNFSQKSKRHSSYSMPLILLSAGFCL